MGAELTGKREPHQASETAKALKRAAETERRS